MRNKSKSQRGFTVIELLIATAVFSVVLLVFVTSFLRLSELFYKGVNLTNTQESARNMIQSISSDIQFYNQAPQVFPSENYFCIGTHRYTYVPYVQYDPSSSSAIGMIKENLPNCVSPTIQPANLRNGQEMLDPGMQINKMIITCNASGLCSVSTHLVYYSNDPTVLSPSSIDPAALCTGPASSTQFCATADYSSTILQNW